MRVVLFFTQSLFNISIKGVLSGANDVTGDFQWPSHLCIHRENEPIFFANVGSYAKDILSILRKDGDDECQTEVTI